MSPSRARTAAVNVLERVAREDAYASAALDAALRRTRCDARDAALATEIVYGVLRRVPELDAALAAQLDRPLDALDGTVHAVLRASLYQLRALDRVPAHAVVDDAVTIVRERRGARLGGLVNAVLRRLADHPGAVERSAARGLVLPPWVEATLARGVGAARAKRFLEDRAMPPYAGVRVLAGRTTREALREAWLRERPGAEVVPSALCTDALLVRRAGDLRELAGYREAAWVAQEEGSQLVVAEAAVGQGERVLDACAGRGGKALAFAERAGGSGRVVAVDKYPEKLERLTEERARLRLDGAPIETRAIDLTVGLGDLAPEFDRVVVDAPCSGLGTIHRRPEILLRLGEADLARLADVQRRILEAASRLVRPGGLLVYAVCSPAREEGEEVAAAIEAGARRLVRVHERLGPLAPDDDGAVRIGPWLASGPEGPDAYQVFRWRV